MDEYKLSKSEIAGLNLLHRTLKKKREADKVKVVYSLGAGYSVSDVAFMLDISTDTVKHHFAD